MCCSIRILWAAMLAVPLVAAPLRLKWHELDAWTGPDKRIRIVTQERVVLHGILEKVEPDALAVEVKFSSDQVLYRPGRTVIPRSSISGISVRREKRTGRQRGMLVGFFVGLLSAPLAAQGAKSDAGAVAGGIVSMTMNIGLGYLIGLSSDHSWTEVRLEPPPERTTPPGGEER
ncbi:MAG: hypothetical protein NZR01_02765 [Bryobacteraceae bacterium]|nr:hypothetical protein [Bryobacteraceae bacterium]